MSEQLIWTGQASGTARDAAEQFVREQFGVDRTIRFSKTDSGVFWFADGMWSYRVVIEQGRWAIYRTNEKTNKGREYSKAKRRASQ